MPTLIRLASHVPIGPLLREVDARPEAFGWDCVRQDAIPCQRHTETVALRVPTSADRPAGVPSHHWHRSALGPYARLYPASLGFARHVAQRFQAELARVMLVSLAPRSQVYPHWDYGDYYACRDRFHLVLRSRHGSVLMAGHEQAVLRPGELWVFDNKQSHAAVNPSGAPRLHLIFDALPTPGRGFFTGPPPG